MVLDNGKTFKAAAKVIQSVVSHDDVKQYLSNLGVKWVFNLPKARWWGAIFERLIRSVKRCLRKIIWQARLSYDELTTAIVEVEAMINSRPLTYVAMDILDEPLTPFHLLTGHRILSLPDNLCCKPEEVNETPDIGHSQLTRRACHLNNTLDSFWRRWRKEYLLELREAHRYHHGQASTPQVAVDNMVVVHTKNQPRTFWKLGRVSRCWSERIEKSEVLLFG